MTTPGELQPGATVGEYQIERVIGEGSFGRVYAAVHPMIGKHAAIKVLSFEHSAHPQFVSRFLEEARAVNKIRHRNIVDIFSFGKLDDGRHYLVMELLEGKPMKDWLEERGAVPVHEALPILRKVARALEAAHKQGIAHRDLKPDNVFLTFDEDGIVFPVLLDFGIAKLMGDSPMGHKTQTGTPMGTPLYMSPEQCRGGHMDHHTDIYSFGILIFEILTGKRPFDSENVMEILMAHLSETPPLMSQVNPSLSKALDPPVQRMLEKKPDKRPPSITIAVEALIAAAQSAGIAVPSSRDASMIGVGSVQHGGTAPMGLDDAPPGMKPPGALGIKTVPEGPMDPTLDPRQIHVHMAVTKESPVYTGHATPEPVVPPAAQALTNAGASISPADTSIPKPPSTQRNAGGGNGLLFAIIGIFALALVGGGIWFAIQPKPDDTTESEEEEDDDDDDDDSDDDGATGGSSKPKPETRPEPTPKKDGTQFVNMPLATGEIASTVESTRMTFTAVQGAKKTNISSAVNTESRLAVLSGGAGGVTKAEITFTVAERHDSQNHATPVKSKEPEHGKSYEVSRDSSGIAVAKKGGALDNEERESVQKHVSGRLTINELASVLGGKTVALGEKLDLPFGVILQLIRETERTKWPKLTASITLQKVVNEDGAPTAVFNLHMSFSYKDDDGTLLSSDLSGSLHVLVSNARVRSLEVYGPLNITHPTNKFEPGTFTFNYKNRFER